MQVLANLQKIEEIPLSHKLGRLKATSISGNDLLSSCLYTSGVTIAVVRARAPLWLCLTARCCRSI